MIRSELVVTKKTPLTSRGLVVAEHPLGAEVGGAILARGGNAIDAAVATAFAMTVVEPFMSTIGGAGTMLVHLASESETLTVDFNAVAPAAAYDGMYRVVGGGVSELFAWPRVQDDANVVGPRAVAVPGSVAGLTLALERFGTMELADVLRPAIALARDGFVHDWYQALTTARFIEELSAFPESARVYLRGRGIYRPTHLEPGDRATYPDLARTLELIAHDGADAFYRGAIAQAIDDHMRATGGPLTRADLAEYSARVDVPLWGQYRDVDLAWSAGPTGGVTALEILNILEQFPAASVAGDTVEGLHVRAHATARAFLDRLALLGDPAEVKAPWERLASKEYAREVATDIRRSRGKPAVAAAGSRRAGSLPSGRAAVGRGPRARHFADHRPALDCTTHVGVIDRHRNMVSLTHTAVSLFGSRMVVPGTGILLNNAMLWFDPETARPNSVGPRRRVLCNMTPVLGFRRGRPYLTLGAPGGRRIVSAVPQVLATLIDRRCAFQAAVEAPRLHTEGGDVWIDQRVGDKVIGGLRRRGHSVVPREETFATLQFAKPIGVRITDKGLEAGLDHLRPAAAAGH
ncbi:MAG TPA: gamma-glutamyltransferase [Candidatus Acidoferrum sp.]|nr:gamma-glutamyltransferase [Candidatus Acidoferrum sp.]